MGIDHHKWQTDRRFGTNGWHGYDSESDQYTSRKSKLSSVAVWDHSYFLPSHTESVHPDANWQQEGKLSCSWTWRGENVSSHIVLFAQLLIILHSKSNLGDNEHLVYSAVSSGKDKGRRDFSPHLSLALTRLLTNKASGERASYRQRTFIQLSLTRLSSGSLPPTSSSSSKMSAIRLAKCTCFTI